MVTHFLKDLLVSFWTSFKGHLRPKRPPYESFSFSSFVTYSLKETLLVLPFPLSLLEDDIDGTYVLKDPPGEWFSFFHLESSFSFA